MTDQPIAFRPDGSPIYDNAATVCCMIAEVLGEAGCVVIRRNTNPGLGLLALPGGFQMRGESAEDAALREFEEECGAVADCSLFWDSKFLGTDEYGHNIIAVFGYIEQDGYEQALGQFNKNEVSEIVLMTYDQFFDTPKSDWAFPMHQEAVHDWFEQT